MWGFQSRWKTRKMKQIRGDKRWFRGKNLQSHLYANIYPSAAAAQHSRFVHVHDTESESEMAEGRQSNSLLCLQIHGFDCVFVIERRTVSIGSVQATFLFPGRRRSRRSTWFLRGCLCHLSSCSFPRQRVSVSKAQRRRKRGAIKY